MEINPTAREWKIVEEWAKRRLTSNRTTIENVNVDPIMTAYTRGRIAELKALLALATTPETGTNE